MQGVENGVLVQTGRKAAMNRESELLAAIAKASTAAEQRKLMAELDDLRAERSRKVREAREIDLADTHIRDTLTPVRVHERVTAASDWLEELPESGGEYHKAMRTEATMWFKRVSSEVKADRDEFAEQAQGMARYLAGKYGTDAEAARIAFLEEVARLHTQANDSPGQVNEEQSGNAESQVTDYDPKTGQDPMWGEDWDGEDDTGSQIGSEYHPGQPGAGEKVSSRVAAVVEEATCTVCGNPIYMKSPFGLWSHSRDYSENAHLDADHGPGVPEGLWNRRGSRKAGGVDPKGRKARVAPRQAASNYLDYPEGTTAVCTKCKERILLDQREGGGPGKDWGARPEDWVGNGGIGMDYGCAGASDDEDDLGIAGEGNGHYPDISTIQLPRTARKAQAVRKTAGFTYEGIEWSVGFAPAGSKCRRCGNEFKNPIEAYVKPGGGANSRFEGGDPDIICAWCASDIRQAQDAGLDPDEGRLSFGSRKTSGGKTANSDQALVENMIANYQGGGGYDELVDNLRVLQGRGIAPDLVEDALYHSTSQYGSLSALWADLDGIAQAVGLERDPIMFRAIGKTATKVMIDHNQTQSCQGCGWSIVLAGMTNGYCSVCSPLACPKDGTRLSLDSYMENAVCERGLHSYPNGATLDNFESLAKRQDQAKLAVFRERIKTGTRKVAYMGTTTTTYGITLDTDGTYYGWRSTDTLGPEGEVEDRDYASYGTDATNVTDAYTELVAAGFLPSGQLVNVSADHPDEEQVWEVQ